MFAVAQKIANFAGYDLVPTQANVAQPAEPVTRDDKQLSLDKQLHNIEHLLKSNVPLVAINEMAKHINEDPVRIEHLFKSMLDPNKPYLLLSIQGHCLNLKRMGNTPGAAALLTLMSKTEGVHSAIQQISRLNVDESEDKENASVRQAQQRNNNKEKSNPYGNPLRPSNQNIVRTNSNIVNTNSNVHAASDTTSESTYSDSSEENMPTNNVGGYAAHSSFSNQNFSNRNRRY